MKEWMPKNPCPCGTIRYPDGHKCNDDADECSTLAYYKGAIDYQRKLLEHLIANVADPSRQFESMLSQLEESK